MVCVVYSYPVGDFVKLKNVVSRLAESRSSKLWILVIANNDFADHFTVTHLSKFFFNFKFKKSRLLKEINHLSCTKKLRMY